MAANLHRQSMSVEDYFALEYSQLEIRYEFIDGFAYMLAGGTANHALIATNLVGILYPLLRGTSCRLYNSDMRVQLSETRYVYPAVTVSCDERDRGAVETLRFPRLVVEILSPSTEGYDRGRKFSYYRGCPTLKEYVLIDTQLQAVDVYRRQTDNLWTLHPFGPDDEVELSSIGIRLPIAALYENVTFADDQ